MGFLSNLTDQFRDPLDLFGGRAQQQATDVQTQLSQEGLDLQRELFQQLFADQGPVRGARDEALGLLKQLQEGTFDPFLDPSLGFQREEGLRNIQQQQAAKGKFGAGERFTREQDFSAGLEADAVNQAINRILNLAGFSTEDISQTNPLLQSNINQQGGILQNLGGIQARGIIGQGNARNQALNTGFGILGSVNPGGVFG